MFIDYLKEGREFIIEKNIFETQYPFHSLLGYVIGHNPDNNDYIIQVACHADEDPQSYQRFKMYTLPENGPVNPVLGTVCYMEIDGQAWKQELQTLAISPETWLQRVKEEG